MAGKKESVRPVTKVTDSEGIHYYLTGVFLDVLLKSMWTYSYEENYTFDKYVGYTQCSGCHIVGRGFSHCFQISSRHGSLYKSLRTSYDYNYREIHSYLSLQYDSNLQFKKVIIHLMRIANRSRSFRSIIPGLNVHHNGVINNFPIPVVAVDYLLSEDYEAQKIGLILFIQYVMNLCQGRRENFYRDELWRIEKTK